MNPPLDASVVQETNLLSERSFLAVNNPSVQVVAFKPAEHHLGWYVIRLQEIGGEQAENVQIMTRFQSSEAVLVSTFEVPSGEKADLSRLTLKPWQTMTILAQLAGPR